nr:reverse transcriptase domain-containing protein [Tanacetum cinerariifolium]
MFKQLHLNITLAKALVLMPKYQKMLKALLSNKEKLQELANTPLNENCSAVILKKLPEKLGDPGKFLIPCGFSKLKCKALADIGASINLMPLSIWKKLGLPDQIPTQMTLELANRAICTPDGIARDVFVPVGKFTLLADFVVVDCESDPRVPLMLGRPFLRTARALIDIHGEEIILRDEDEMLTLNMKHDTASYSNHPYRDSVNLINIFNLSSEDCLKDLVSNKQRGNPTFSLLKEIAAPEVILEIHRHFDDDPLSGSTTYSANSLLEEFADELALISYPSDYDDNHTYLIDQSVLTHCDDLFVDPIPEMFTDEQPPDYSFPLRFDMYPDDFLEIESDANFDDDSFDSEGEKIKEAELLIDQLDLHCDILSEYDSFNSQDFSRDDVLFSSDNEDKVKEYQEKDKIRSKPEKKGSGNYVVGQPRVLKYYNCQEEGHMVRQCTLPKRPRNVAWFKEKLFLAKAQETGQILDEKQLEFLADPRISEPLVSPQTIPQNSAFQTEYLDAYDSDCDDLSSATAILMGNLSSYDPEVLSEVSYSDSYPNDIINQDMQEM